MHLGKNNKKKFFHGQVLRLNASSCAGLNCFQIKTKSQPRRTRNVLERMKMERKHRKHSWNNNNLLCSKIVHVANLKKNQPFLYSLRKYLLVLLRDLFSKNLRFSQISDTNQILFFFIIINYYHLRCGVGFLTVNVNTLNY